MVKVYFSYQCVSLIKILGNVDGSDIYPKNFEVGKSKAIPHMKESRLICNMGLADISCSQVL